MRAWVNESERVRTCTKGQAHRPIRNGRNDASHVKMHHAPGRQLDGCCLQLPACLLLTAFPGETSLPSLLSSGKAVRSGT